MNVQARSKSWVPYFEGEKTFLRDIESGSLSPVV